MTAAFVPRAVHLLTTGGAADFHHGALEHQMDVKSRLPVESGFTLDDLGTLAFNYGSGALISMGFIVTILHVFLAPSTFNHSYTESLHPLSRLLVRERFIKLLAVGALSPIQRDLYDGLVLVDR